MPQPSTSITPSAAWETAETSEMHEIAPLYGKTYHFWQVDRGDVVPMGEPKLMGSFTDEQTVQKVVGQSEDVKRPSERLCELTGRDKRFGVDVARKSAARTGIEDTQVIEGKQRRICEIRSSSLHGKKLIAARRRRHVGIISREAFENFSKVRSKAHVNIERRYLILKAHKMMSLRRPVFRGGFPFSLDENGSRVTVFVHSQWRGEFPNVSSVTQISSQCTSRGN